MSGLIEIRRKENTDKFQIMPEFSTFERLVTHVYKIQVLEIQLRCVKYLSLG